MYYIITAVVEAPNIIRYMSHRRLYDLYVQQLINVKFVLIKTIKQSFVQLLINTVFVVLIVNKPKGCTLHIKYAGINYNKV